MFVKKEITVQEQMVIKSRMEGKNVKIIYEDTEKLIVEKPAGVLTQSARSFDTDIVSEVLTYRRSKKETAYAAVINRLDRPVGGLVLFAKTKQGGLAVKGNAAKYTE